MLPGGAVLHAADRCGSRSDRRPEGSFQARPPTHTVGHQLSFTEPGWATAPRRIADGRQDRCHEGGDDATRRLVASRANSTRSAHVAERLHVLERGAAPAPLKHVAGQAPHAPQGVSVDQPGVQAPTLSFQRSSKHSRRKRIRQPQASRRPVRS